MHKPFQQIFISLVTILTLMWSGVGYTQNIVNGLGANAQSGCQNMQSPPLKKVEKSSSKPEQASSLDANAIDCHNTQSIKGNHCPSCSTSVIAVSSLDALSLELNKPILNPTSEPSSHSITSPPLSRPPIQSFSF
ncbi:hypothetical protein [Vibrio rumoiensis]|uniref:DUF2946 domain-containing protein n=1 Tax=Vibrio rumoiensis 1S-45 TaxID=1188252 RepID=A0A1E5E2L2_9VIBR|nr:hypothetical protein [Vibrio rumoiensis]OEF25759.1 hypothetical protein A1QC_08305 [Vibrio rumoiensis 1S-45]